MLWYSSINTRDYPCSGPGNAFHRVNSNTGVQLVAVGGNYNSNDNYGMFYFNANWNVTETNGNLGSRHLVYKSCYTRHG